jgi:hypothetical protein
MRPLIILVAALVSGACSVSTRTATEAADSNRQVSVAEPLTLTVTDAPARPGMLWARPLVTGAAGSVSVRSTRYGSVCRYETHGQASVTPGRITLEIQFFERTALCTGDIRALTYDAQIKAPAGTYDVTVVHQENGAREVAQRQTIAVP